MLKAVAGSRCPNCAGSAKVSTNLGFFGGFFAFFWVFGFFLGLFGVFLGIPGVFSTCASSRQLVPARASLCQLEF